MRVGVVHTVNSICRCADAIADGLRALGHEPVLADSEEMESLAWDLARGCDLIIDRGICLMASKWLQTSRGSRLARGLDTFHLQGLSRRSGGDRCYPGTSSGKPLQKGVVRVQYDWYLAVGGQQLYIPGYGYATIGDVCNGCRGKAWVDLGYSDSDWQQWSSWVTVYFLTPVPANIVYDLQ